MRIAIVHESINAERGGAESAVGEMAQELAGRGLDVTVVVQQVGAAPTSTTPSSDSVRLVSLPIRGTSKLGRTRAFVAAADEFCRRERFDIVHAITPCETADLYQPRGGTYAETIRRSLALHRNPLVRMVKTFGRLLNARQQFLLDVERRIMERARPAYVAAVSAYVARQIRDNFPAHPAEKTRVVFNAVAPPPIITLSDEQRQVLRAEQGVAGDAPVALFVAHNFKLKGLRELLAAFRLIHHASRNVVLPRLLVCGAGNWQPYARHADDLLRSGAVVYLGPRRDIPRLLAAADLLIHPTWYDPCSRVVLEALCCGLPVVTTSLNGAAEAIRPDVTGVVVASPADVDELAKGILRCTTDDIRTAAKNQTAEMRQRLSMARHAAELEAYYRAIIAQRG